MTLIEGVFFITAALSLIVGGVQVYKKVQMAAREQSQIRAMSAIVAETRIMYRNTKFEGESGTKFPIDAVLAVSGAVPKHLIKPPPWAGVEEVLLTEWGSGMAQWIGTSDLPKEKKIPTIFTYFFGIPVEACSRLAVSDERGQGAYSAGFLFVQYTRPVWFPDGTTPKIYPPNRPHQAAAACKQNAVRGRVNLYLQFRLSGH